MADDKFNKIFNEQVCPVCGKTFFKPVESIYKYTDKKTRKVRYTCSYKCYVSKLKEYGRW